MDRPSHVTMESAALAESALRLTEGFAHWPAAGMATLLTNSRLNRHSRGDVIESECEETPETLAVVSGYLMLERHVGEKSAVVGLVGPGTVVGLTYALHHDSGAALVYRVHDEALIIHIPSDLLLSVLDADPALWREMARMLLRQKQEMRFSLLTQMQGSLDSRVAATIARLATLYGFADGAAIRLRLRIKQGDLAAMLQVSRPTINRALIELEAARLITLEYNAIAILDPAGLRKRMEE